MLLWIIVVLPLLVGVVVSVAAVDWQELANAVKNTGGDFGKFEGANPALAGSLLYLLLAPLWAMIAATLAERAERHRPRRCRPHCAAVHLSAH